MRELNVSVNWLSEHSDGYSRSDDESIDLTDAEALERELADQADSPDYIGASLNDFTKDPTWRSYLDRDNRPHVWLWIVDVDPRRDGFGQEKKYQGKTEVDYRASAESLSTDPDVYGFLRRTIGRMFTEMGMNKGWGDSPEELPRKTLTE